MIAEAKQIMIKVLELEERVTMFNHVNLMRECVRYCAKHKVNPNSIEVIDDLLWHKHIVVPLCNGYVSLYCGGLDKYIEIAVINHDKKTLETHDARFATPKGAANWVKRFLDQGGKVV